MSEALNQVPPLDGWNPFSSDVALVEAMEREGAGWARPAASAFGERAGSAEVTAWGFDANRYPPVLRTHDRHGNRLDVVDYHPAYHELMALSVGHGLHAGPWADDRAGAHVARAALFMVMAGVEAGHGCPVSMTYSCVPTLRRQSDLASEWEPRVTSFVYDSQFKPAPEKRGALLGMAMTEKQGGSDVRANITRADPAGDGEYLVTGHKWFCSAPMCDAFLVLAQSPGGLSCFLLPRFTPDGDRNHFFIQRLKDKLGNRSNASSEVEFEAAWARLVGEEGRGVATIIEMVAHTRLDCVLGSTGGIRRAVSEAHHHAAHRQAFGKLLVEQHLMRNVLADLAVEAEAATLTAMRLAGAFDRAAGEPYEEHFRRLATPVVKYWICKRQPAVVAEALECLGGNGYVEESISARLFRESPLNGIWEGSGNVIALDVLRAIRRDPASLDAFMSEALAAVGADRRLDDHTDRLQAALAGGVAGDEGSARRLVEMMALALQGSLVVRYSPPAVADAFCGSRLGGDWGRTLGTLPAGTALEPILERAVPG